MPAGTYTRMAPSTGLRNLLVSNNVRVRHHWTVPPTYVSDTYCVNHPVTVAVQMSAALAVPRVPFNLYIQLSSSNNLPTQSSCVFWFARRVGKMAVGLCEFGIVGFVVGPARNLHTCTRKAGLVKFFAHPIQWDHLIQLLLSGKATHIRLVQLV